MVLAHAKFSFGVTLANLIALARVHAGISDFNHLGKTTDEQDIYLTILINRIIADFHRKNPTFAQGSATLTLKSGETAIYDFPATLRDFDILEVRMVINSVTGDSIPVPFVPRETFITFPTTGSSLDEYRCSLTTDGANLAVYPPIDSSTSLLMYYRLAFTEMLKTDLSNPSYSITALPTIAQMWASLELAGRTILSLKPKEALIVLDRAKTELKSIQSMFMGTISLYRNRVGIVNRQAFLDQLRVRLLPLNY